MATLNNISDDTSIVFSLNKTREFPEWLGYRLEVFVKDDGKTRTFFRFNDEETILTFDNLLEPEIPALCDAIHSIVNDKIVKYSFEPIDEKDFCLGINKKGHCYIVSLFMSDGVLFEDYKWKGRSQVGVKMKVDKNNLVDFLNELKKEYNQVTG